MIVPNKNVKENDNTADISIRNYQLSFKKHDCSREKLFAKLHFFGGHTAKLYFPDSLTVNCCHETGWVLANRNG